MSFSERTYSPPNRNFNYFHLRQMRKSIHKCSLNFVGRGQNLLSHPSRLGGERCFHHKEDARNRKESPSAAVLRVTISGVGVTTTPGSRGIHDRASIRTRLIGVSTVAKLTRRRRHRLLSACAASGGVRDPFTYEKIALGFRPIPAAHCGAFLRVPVQARTWKQASGEVFVASQDWSRRSASLS